MNPPPWTEPMAARLAWLWSMQDDLTCEELDEREELERAVCAHWEAYWLAKVDRADSARWSTP